MNIQLLQEKSLYVRERILRMSTDGGCFTGASLSCTDILVYLYQHFLRCSPQTVNDPLRDYLFLSKGHDVPALYAVLAAQGFIDESRLQNHLRATDDIYWHPNRNIPGIEFHSGSLGHLLSVAMGVAYDCRMRKQSNRVVVIMGDGELNEGSVWEGFLVTASLALGNVVVVIDRNWFQANIRTEELNPLEPLEDKFKAFHWNVKRIDGHDFEALHACFSTLPDNNGRPTVVIADTVRGKGVPSIAEKADRWFCNFTHDEVSTLIAELHGGQRTIIESESLMVR